jgi:hypothetical protein
MEHAAIEEAMIISADPLPIWADGQQWQGSVDVDEEGGEEEVEKGTDEEWTEGTAD